MYVSNLIYRLNSLVIIFISSQLIGCISLHTYVDSGNVEKARVSIKEGADVNLRNSETGRSPLDTASGFGNVEMVKLLISNGANVDSKGDNGETALHYAVVNKQYEVVKLLISKNANIYLKDRKGKSPLDYAKSEPMISLFGEASGDKENKEPNPKYSNLKFNDTILLMNRKRIPNVNATVTTTSVIIITPDGEISTYKKEEVNTLIRGK